MSGTAGYEVVRYGPDRKADVAALMGHLSTRDISLNIAYLEWKHERNPYMEEPLIYLAFDRSRLVGMRSMLGVCWEAGNPPERRRGICPDDMVIAPDHRSRGVSITLMRQAFADLEAQGYEYVSNLSAGKVTRLSSLAMGWRSLGSMKPQRWRSARAGMVQRLRGQLQGMRFLWRFAGLLPYREWGREQRSIHDFCGPAGAPPRRLGPNVIADREPRPLEMARLVSRIAYDGRIRHVRDEVYLGWRFRNPLHRYLFLYWLDGDMGGYLVLQQYLSDPSRNTVVNIVDWEAADIRIKAELLRAALRLGPFSDLTVWTVSLGSDDLTLLENAGFRPIPEGGEGAGVEQEHPCLLVRTIPAGGEGRREPAIGGRGLLEMANWDIRMLYSMHG